MLDKDIQNVLALDFPQLELYTKWPKKQVTLFVFNLRSAHSSKSIEIYLDDNWKQHELNYKNLLFLVVAFRC